MTTTTLHITVGDREQVRNEAIEVADAIDNAPPGEKPTLPENLDGRSVLQFGTYDDLVDSLTPLRLALIRAIAEQDPQSMREAARLVDRDVSDVHSDLKQLEVLGVLDLEEGGPSGAIKPVVPFDRIEMHIDYSLIDDNAGDGTTASAD